MVDSLGLPWNMALKYYSSMHTSSGQREWVGVVCYRLSYVVGCHHVRRVVLYRDNIKSQEQIAEPVKPNMPLIHAD